MTRSNPLPFGITLCRIQKDDLHYLQRSARRNGEEFEDVLHRIIENHRYPGAQENPETHEIIINEGGPEHE